MACLPVPLASGVALCCCGSGFPVWFAVGRRAIPAAGGVDIVTVSVVLGPSETVPMSGLGDCTLCRLVCPGGPGKLADSRIVSSLSRVCCLVFVVVVVYLS